jgi:hypothetical protein
MEIGLGLEVGEGDRRGSCYGWYWRWHWCLAVMLQSAGSMVSSLIF